MNIYLILYTRICARVAAKRHTLPICEIGVFNSSRTLAINRDVQVVRSNLVYVLRVAPAARLMQ